MKYIEFDRSKSVKLKGIAILFMFWIHLYCHDELLQNGIYYLSIFKGYDHTIIKIVLGFCSICVPLYIFMAGYAYGTRILTKPPKLWPIVKKMYTKYWIVFLVFIPLCFATGVIQFDLLECIKNLTGFYYTYCGEWWFFSLYIELEVVAYLIHKLKGWYVDVRIIIFISFSLMCLGYAMKLVKPTVTVGNTPINLLYTF